MSTIDTGYGAAPLDDDELEQVLPIRRRRLPLLTRLLLAALVAAGAFVVGVEVQRHYGASAGASGGASATGSFAARRAALGGGRGGAGRAGGGAGFFGRGSAAGAGGGATVGLVTLIR